MSSPLALGSVQWGMNYGIANTAGCPPPQELNTILRLAQSHGVHIIDTARAYGSSEQRIGECIGSNPAWTIVTKLSPILGEEKKEALEEQTQRSLQLSRRALKRDHLEIVLLHRFAHRTMANEAVWKCLLNEREAGKIGKLGVSVASPEEAWEALGDPHIEVLQVATSLLDLRLWRGRFFERANREGRLIFVRSVFLQGAVFLDPNSLPKELEPTRPVLIELRKWCRERNISLSTAFLAFVRLLDPATPIVGCETAEQMKECLELYSDSGKWCEEVKSLATSIPELPSTVLDPSQWKFRQPSG